MRFRCLLPLSLRMPSCGMALSPAVAYCLQAGLLGLLDNQIAQSHQVFWKGATHVSSQK